MEIRTARLLMRLWRDEDRAPFAALCSDAEVMAYFPSPNTAQQCDALVARIQKHFAEHGYGLWALEDDTGFVGFTGLAWATFAASFTPALEVGWRLARSAWGKGYASEAATAALTEGLRHEASIVSFTSLTNARSIAVMERIGMHRDSEFDHPKLEPGHRLRRHVLYRADRQTWMPHSVLA